MPSREGGRWKGVESGSVRVRFHSSKQLQEPGGGGVGVESVGRQAGEEISPQPEMTAGGVWAMGLERKGQAPQGGRLPWPQSTEAAGGQLCGSRGDTRLRPSHRRLIKAADNGGQRLGGSPRITPLSRATASRPHGRRSPCTHLPVWEEVSGVWARGQQRSEGAGRPRGAEGHNGRVLEGDAVRLEGQPVGPEKLAEVGQHGGTQTDT